jgi:DNA-directed RNA polymerase specialized sigma subunit, sigma24 homolog
MKARINTPELNDSIIGWIYNEAYRNLWRVNKWYDFEDLVQDGLIIALKCRTRYGDIDPANFTAMVKTSFKNHIIGLQRHKSYVMETSIAELAELKHVSEEKALDSISEPVLPDQEIACVLSELPEPVKAVLRLFLSSDNLRKLRLPLRVTLNGRETTAKRLNRLAGWPEKKDFASELEKLLFPVDLYR